MAGSIHCSDKGRDVKSQREGETKREGWGEMDRGEDRDLLSSGIFDGSPDHLYNKRLIANDSNRKRDRERGRERGERYYFHSDAFSHTGVMFHRPRQQDSSVIWIPRQTTSQTKSQYETLRVTWSLSQSPSQSLTLVTATFKLNIQWLTKIDMQHA